MFDERSALEYIGGMGSKRLDSLAAYARHGCKLRVDCQCGRVVLLNPYDLLAVTAARGRPRYSLEQLQMKLRCERCGSRPKQIGPQW